MSKFAVFNSFLFMASFAYGHPIGQVSYSEDKDDEIKKWITQLEDSSLTKRQQAKRSLKEAGKTAIPELTISALSDKRETITHSIELLSDMANNSDNDETKKAARIALEMLAKSEKQSTAERANLALSTEKEKGIQPFPGWNKKGNEFARGRRNESRTVSVSSINGVRTITVSEGGKTTRFQDMDNGAIQVQIDDGKKTIKFLAADGNDLKTKNPSAFELFIKYSGGNQNPRKGGFAISKNGGIQIKNNGQFGVNLDATKMLERQLNTLKNNFPNDPTMKMLIEKQLESIKDH